MASTGSPTSDRADSAPVVPEDATTIATREELSHTTISETDKPQQPVVTSASASTSTDPPAISDSPSSSKTDDPHDLVASPKKKRAHDQILDTPDKAAAQNSGPEKKRARDGEDEKSDDKEKLSKDKLVAPVTSAAAFAKSGFAAHANSTTSPFGTAAAGTSSKSIFGSGSSSGTPPFGSAASSSTSTPKLSFSTASGASPFGSLGGAVSSSTTKTFGSGLGSGSGGSIFGGGSSVFGASALGGGKLSSFATLGGAATFGTKSAKPFGAPESDIESEEGDKDDDVDSDKEGDDKEAGDEKPEKTEKSDKEKKLKLHKVEVNDGEYGEATIISVRARLYFLDKENGWKERGAGNVKINVPKACVEFDSMGAVVPGSFDASVLTDEKAVMSAVKGARIIMRQDQTGRVILNTVLLPALMFQLKEGLKSTGVLFTAIEDGKPINVHLKMTAINARNWMNEVSIVQRELSSSV